MKPTSFFIVQSLLTHANPSIVMENCESIESFGYGLHIALMDHVQINNFRLTDPAGIDGKGAVVGGVRREERYLWIPASTSMQRGGSSLHSDICDG
ncbi:hypothetical protein [Methanoculleus chikugoensis]|uniref:hypothetical protein n=1 Tax=Methanoculleus chikugoensis TaxID=118126 RepID=UPI0006D17A69|nr:hypothetical protein [Methanoculleus chikugoensis]